MTVSCKGLSAGWNNTGSNVNSGWDVAIFCRVFLSECSLYNVYCVLGLLVKMQFLLLKQHNSFHGSYLIFLLATWKKGVCISDMIPFYLGKLFRESGPSDDVCSKVTTLR